MSDTPPPNRPGAKGKPLPHSLLAPNPRIVTPWATPPVRLLYYPDAFKRHYMELLRRYRDELSQQTGRRIGWQTIRDMMMEPEDRAVSDSLARSGAANDKARVRSTLVTLDNMKSWMDDDILPSDVKFQYVERFIRSLRVRGQLDEIEHALDHAQREYIGDALRLFYRPSPSVCREPGERQDRIMPGVRELLSHSCYVLPALAIESEPAQARVSVCLLILHDYGDHVTPLDIVSLREAPPSGAPLDAVDFVPLYTGFLITETILPAIDLPTVSSELGLMGKLIVSKMSGATAGDDGYAAMSEGGTFECMAKVTSAQIDLLLSVGDGLTLFAGILGAELPPSAASVSVGGPPLKRIQRDARIETLQHQLAFRYRTWQ